MPLSPMKPCCKVGCGTLARKRFCEIHAKEKHLYDQYRGTAAQRGYDSKWRKARRAFLLKHPLCVNCLRKDFVIEAIIVDHITPHKGDNALFWDCKNWQSLCKACHDAKTVQKDGGFGYKKNT